MPRKTDPEIVPEYVRVTGRNDVATIIKSGKKRGGRIKVYCYVLLFPATGEVCYYDYRAVTPVDADGNPIQPSP